MKKFYLLQDSLLESDYPESFQFQRTGDGDWTFKGSKSCIVSTFLKGQQYTVDPRVEKNWDKKVFL